MEPRNYGNAKILSMHAGQLDRLLALAVQAALEAGTLLQGYQGKMALADVTAKSSPVDLVSVADRASEALLREQLAVPGLEIDSVDGFQGREKEAVLISLVRSSARGEIGFLADVRRMNVAMTRARRKLIVVGDSATLSNHGFYRRMLDYFESLGAYRSVWEL